MHIRTSGLSLPTDADLHRLAEGVLQDMKASNIGGGILAQCIEHREVDAITRKYGSRFKGLLNMLPDVPADLEDIERYGANRNIIGIKIYPNQFPGSDFIQPLMPVLNAIRTRRWIIQVHSNPVTMRELGLPLAVRRLATKVDLPVVMVHSGGHQFLQLYGLRAVPDNLFFDTSAVQNMFCDSPFLPHLRHAFDRLGDHLLFASDYPDFSFADAVAAFHLLGFDGEQARAIGRENCLWLLRTYVDTDTEGFGNPD
jgi:predicted TIM-barrel fold metal-dependent hydrolase